MKKQVSIAVIGAGSRGLYSYAQYVYDNPDSARIVAVAEPRDFFRNRAAQLHKITKENIFTTWQELLSRPRLADAVIITTPDTLHKDPALAAAAKGYHILLEKPMAITLYDCIEIAKAAKSYGIIFAVCHVLRYAPFYKKIKEIIDAGLLGDICTVQHMEGVGWWHQAHSYVRGQWRNSKNSSFMLLAKSCHDIDVISWWIGKTCLRVSSFGHLKHFRKESKPSQAASRCMNCCLADEGCAYSAKKFYFNQLRNGRFEWPLSVVVNSPSEKDLEHALREGDYGRCVYECDNDVVDHQVVIMEFADNITADFTMSAFTPLGRKTRIMGSKGYLEGDEQIIKVLSFSDEKWLEYDVNKLAGDVNEGHGGGDSGLMKAFIETVRLGKAEYLTTSPQELLESYLIVFAAEKSRLEGCVVNIDSLFLM